VVDDDRSASVANSQPELLAYGYPLGFRQGNESLPDGPASSSPTARNKAAKDGFLLLVAAFVGFAPVIYEFVYETTFRSISACQITTGIGSTKVLLGELVSERLSASSGN